MVPKNHLTTSIPWRLPTSRRAAKRDCCFVENPLRLILSYAFLWQSWVALGSREQRTNPGYNCSTGEPKRRLLASRLSWKWHCKYANLCLSLQTTLFAFCFISKNFIAQSNNIKTWSSRRASKMLCLHCSWLWARRMCAFHSLTFSSATSPSCWRSSSFSLLLILDKYFLMAEWISWIASFSTL